MNLRGYLLLIGVLVLGLVWAEATRERPLDLTVRLDPDGRAPFDAQVFFETLPDWLGQPVERVARPPFEHLAGTTVTGQTYLFLAPDFVPDAAEAGRVLDFAARGNTVVVAAHDIRGAFGDSLGGIPPETRRPGVRTQIRYARDRTFGVPVMAGALDPDTLVLVSPGVRQAYRLPVQSQGWHLVGLDSARTEVLGTFGPDGQIQVQRRTLEDSARTETRATVGPWRGGGISLARVRWGRGEVILCSTPLAFSNAALTGDGDGPAYVSAVLAALPDQPVWWAAHAGSPGQAQGSTPLRYVLATPALRWAYGLLVLAGLLYLAFRARRWQRPIPVVAPPPNAQRDFARTVGRLHYTHRDESRLARRQAGHVLDRVRTELGIADPDLTPETARRAAPRAGVPADEALALWATLARVSREARPDPDTLVRLDARIARFFRHTGARAPTD